MNQDQESFEHIFEDIASEKKKGRLNFIKFAAIAVYLGIVITSLLFIFILSQKKAKPEKVEQEQMTVSSASSTSAKNEVDAYAKELELSEGQERTFIWTSQNFDSLIDSGDYEASTLYDVTSRFGRPHSAEGWTALLAGKEVPQLRLYWFDSKAERFASTELVFEKLDDKYRLISKKYSNVMDKGFVVDTELSREFRWTQAGFDALAVGELGKDPFAGSASDEILERFGPPQSIQTSAKGNVSKLSMSYISPKPNPESMKLQQVDLEFVKIASSGWHLIKKTSVALN